MAALGRVVLIAAAVVAPWIYGSIQVWPQFWLAAIAAGLTAMRLLEVLVNRPQEPDHIPTAAVAPLALLLIAAVQLLPRAETPVAAMNHAVFAEDAQAFSASDHAAVGTLSAAATRREAARLYFVLAVFLLAAHWFASRDSFLWLLGALTLNGAALGLFGIIQRLSWNGKLFWSVELRFGGTPFASYVNRNNAAGYLNLCLAAAVGFAVLLLGKHSRGAGLSAGRAARSLRLRFRDRIRLALAGIEGKHVTVIGLLAGLVASVLFSLSRGGVLAMAVAALVVVATAWHGRNRRTLLLLAVIVGGAAFGLLVVAGGLGTVDDRMATLSAPLDAASGRLQHWQDTSGAVRDFPLLGTGIGTYRFANQPYQAHPAHAWYYNADNQWFELLVEAGTVGLVVALLGFLLVVGSSLFLLKQDDARWRAMGVVGLFAVSSQAVQGLTDFGMIVPANGWTLAILAGSVCGAACRAASFHRLRVPASLSATRLEGRFGQAVWRAVLTLAGAAFLLELLTATKAGAARDVHIPLDFDQTQLSVRLESIEDAISAATEALRFRPDDPDLHAEVGDWYVDRYRLQMYQRLLAESTDPKPSYANQLWKASALPALSLRVRQLQTAGQGAQLEQILSLPAVTENLPLAQKHFEASIRHCPLGRNVSLALARLISFERDDDSQDALRYLLMTRFVAPSTPDVLIETGLLAQAGGMTDVAHDCWYRALEVTPEHGPAVWAMATQDATSKEVMISVIPPRADVLLEIAENSDEEAVRRLLASRAEEMLSPPAGEPRADDTSILRARLAELQNQPSLAIRHYQLALSINPWEIDWRLRLARLLRRQGRLSEAEKEYSLLFGQAPARKDIQAERASLRLEIAEQDVRSGLSNGLP